MRNQRLGEYELGVVLALEVAHHCFVSGKGVDQIEEILGSEQLGKALAATFPGERTMLPAIRQGFTDTLGNLANRTAIRTYPYSPKLSERFLDALPQEWRADIPD